MNEKKIFVMALALAFCEFFSLLVCFLGPLLLKLKVESIWLWFWPITMVFVRYMAFLILPAVWLVVAYLALRQNAGTGRIMALIGTNFLGLVFLVIVILKIGSWSRMQADLSINKRFPGISITQKLASPGKGEMSPNIPLVNLDGNEVQLIDQVRNAKVTLVVFWSSYNRGWSQNIPTAISIHKTLANKGVLVLGINVGESAEEVKSFMAKENIVFPVLRDPEGKYFEAFGLLGPVEQMIVVDGEAKLLTKLRDPIDVRETSDETIKKVLLSYLGTGSTE